LQLALALRVSSDATCADDPNFLDPVPNESSARPLSVSASPENMSYRFWVNGCLSYFDKVPDGFYIIQGIDPYIWSICTDVQESGRIPSMESLRVMDPRVESSIDVILVDRRTDFSLKELQNRVHSMSSNCIPTKEVVENLAKLICSRMGGASSTGEEELGLIFKDCSSDLKDCLGSVVLPMGSLSVGLCRHRALLFKALADTIGIQCRIAKGCRYCRRDDASSCLVRFGIDREFMVDLMGKPGFLSEPDSLLNGPSSISISSPLRFPRFREPAPAPDYKSVAKEFFADFQSLNIVFDDEPYTGNIMDGESGGEGIYPRQSERNYSGPSPSNSSEINRQLPPAPRHPRPNRESQPSRVFNMNDNTQNVAATRHINQLNSHRDVQSFIASSDLRTSNTVLDPRIAEGSRELTLDVEDLDIPWSDLVLKEKIGAGSFGTVHRADWNGSDVAVKILMEQDFHAERFNEFLREVSIMRRLRHPNIVLFMGAVTQPPNLSIVTEYLSRGSLYRLLHKPGAKENLDERRRLSMAYDVAKGMNYLHRRNPPVVHRDLKSPNLLVDKKYTVKVCDFGLSRLKARTFLSSKSAAGTPEWMAPEVLRDEPSNEKSDVYSFGVILWELATLQQPWSNLNPAQVVAAVGFKFKRLDIPSGLNPQVASIIEACWANEPWKRPAFSNIMESLRPLIKPPTPQN
jgi:serine/threonine-protein kinase CTR1